MIRATNAAILRAQRTKDLYAGQKTRVREETARVRCRSDALPGLVSAHQAASFRGRSRGDAGVVSVASTTTFESSHFDVLKQGTSRNACTRVCVGLRAAKTNRTEPTGDRRWTQRGGFQSISGWQRMEGETRSGFDLDYRTRREKRVRGPVHHLALWRFPCTAAAASHRW